MWTSTVGYQIPACSITWWQLTMVAQLFPPKTVTIRNTLRHAMRVEVSTKGSTAMIVAARLTVLVLLSLRSIHFGLHGLRWDGCNCAHESSPCNRRSILSAGVETTRRQLDATEARSGGSSDVAGMVISFLDTLVPWLVLSKFFTGQLNKRRVERPSALIRR